MVLVQKVIGFFFCLLVLFKNANLEAEKLKLCSTADWPPYEYTDHQTRHVSGLSVEIVKKIAAQLSLEVEITSLPWERCLKMNETGEMDGIFSVSKKPDRELYLLYPQHEIQNVSYVLAVLKDKQSDWNDQKNTASIPQPIGSPQGFSVTQSLKELKTVQVDDSAPSDQVNIQKLMNNRVESIAISPEVLSNLLQGKAEEGQIKTLSPPYQDSKKYYIAISRKYKGDIKMAEELCKQIDNAFIQISQNTR